LVLIDGKVDEMAKSMTNQMVEFKDEAEHKFALQIAENKRLVTQMSQQKKENQKLVERIRALESRAKAVELEIGNDE
jgi:hypothetical protein